MIQKLFTQLVASLYSTLARTYDLLLNYASDATVIFEESSVESITSSLYTLLGIFMVFRIGITLLTYLIDPDKVSDKSVGAGKLVTRVFTSIVLILTMNTFIFPLLNKLQDALLGSDSIINRLLIEEVDAAPSNCSINVGSTKHFVNCDVTSGSYNIENVKSDITNEIYKFLNNYQYRGLSWTELPRESTNVACSNCIIYNVNYVNTEDVDKGHISNVTVKMINPSVEVVNSYQYGYDSMDFNSWPKYYTTSYEAESSSLITQEYSLPFLSNGTSGEITASFAVAINVNVTEEQSTHRECYYHYYGEYKIYDENDPTKVIESKHGASPYIIKIIYSKNENFDGANMGWGVDWKINSEKCPGENCFDFSKPSVNANNYSFSANNASVKTLNDTGSCPKTISNITCDIKSKTCSLTDNAKISNSKLSGTKTGLTDGQLTYEEALNVSYEEISEAGTGEDFGLSFLSEAVDPKALEFAVNVLRSFTSPSSEITSEFLTDPGVTTAISNKVADGKIRMDTLILLIAGIVLIVLLLTICIEVIVRNMKLLLLQIISPIAIMSYMNPNDKIFSQWVKMYLSTYANLFIQLFIINVGLYFLPMFIKNAGGLRNILIYGGVFIFIKTAPGMISKVLGLDASSGTFKDSFGLVKTGLGIGAGAVAGGVAGVVSGFGAGGGISTIAGGFLGGAFRGAAGGASGKYLEGAQKQIAKNRTAKNLQAQGVGWGTRVLTGMGLKSTRNLDNQIANHKSAAAKQKPMVDYKDSVKTKALSEMLDKNKGTGVSIDSFRRNMSELKRLDNARKSIKESDFKDFVDKDGNVISASAQFEAAYSKLNDQYWAKNNEIYVNKDKTTGLTLEDAAISEMLKSNFSDDLNNMKIAGTHELGEFGIDVTDWASVKSAAGTAGAIMSEQEALARAIENSDEYKSIKAVQDSKK